MTQEQALNILKMGYNVLLTGPPGSGKTYVLNEYISYLRDNDVPVAITASTGIASTHIGGRTIHSWSGLGFKNKIANKDLNRLIHNSRINERINNAEVLIIDEISMLQPEQFDSVNVICQKIRKSDEPFGGLQIVCSGDFFQLPPVRDEKEIELFEAGGFITDSNIWEDTGLKICYLHEQHRHSDSRLASILDNIRNSSLDREMIAKILERKDKNFSNRIQSTRLYTHNKNVDAINDWELEKIKEKPFVFNMVSNGDEKLVKILKKYCLASIILTLKKGAKVMFVKNNFGKGYVNGTIGNVVNFSGDNQPIVRTFNNRLIHVQPESWSIEDEGGCILARITQIPLRLAWAITIHKSQGMTLDAAEVDLGKAFVEGMGYVALSRVRSLNNLVLSGLNDIALKVSDKATLLDKKLLTQSNVTSNWIHKFKTAKIKEAQEEFLQSRRFVDNNQLNNDLENILDEINNKDDLPF